MPRFEIVGTFHGTPVVLTASRRWMYSEPGSWTWTEAEAIYRRLIAIGTAARDIRLVSA